MAIIRHEIHIGKGTVNSSISACEERALLNTRMYSGSCTYYFEADAKYGSGGDIKLYRSDSTLDATLTWTSGETTISRKRTSFTPPTGSTEYMVYRGTTLSSATCNIAKIIIIQDTGSNTLTSSESQIEIGNNTTSSATAATVITSPKYFTYTSANWDGTITAYFEATAYSPTTKSAAHVILQKSSDWSSWSAVTNGDLSFTNLSTTHTRTRSSAVTLEDGYHYRVAVYTPTSKTAMGIYNAKIIIDQGCPNSSSQINQPNNNVVLNIMGSGGATEAAGQTFTIGSNNTTITSVDINVTNKLGTPTDSLYVVIYSSIGGSTLATSESVNPNGTTGIYNFTFQTPNVLSAPTLTANTTYFFAIYRTGSRDSSNYYSVGRSGTTDFYSGGSSQKEDSGSWSTSNYDLYFNLYGYTTTAVAPTKLEEQYLLLNTADGGTGKQTYNTLWSSSEWSSVSNTYYHAIDSDNSSNSGKLVDIDNSDSDVTNSTATGTNQALSSAITMPTSGHQMDVNVTNSTGTVAASRILVYVQIQAATRRRNFPMWI